MQTKLTLTIDQNVVLEAKKYAKFNHKSVSRLVEEYLSGLTGFEKNKEIENISSPLTDQISSLFHDDGRSYKEMLDEARTERFL